MHSPTPLQARARVALRISEFDVKPAHMKDFFAMLFMWVDGAERRVLRGGRNENDIRKYVRYHRSSLVSGPSYGKSEDEIVREIRNLD